MISDVLKLNGKNMPTPDESGIVMNYEPLWSSNSGRTASGLFVGDIVAEKKTVTFTFSSLSNEDISMIENELNTFYEVDFVNPLNPKERIQFTAYRPPRSFPLRKIRKDGTSRFDSFTLDCIER